MPLNFIERPACEICGAPEPETLYAKPFTDPAILPFLQRYYGGAVDAEMLTGATYQIAACRTCGLMWQRFVLDDAGMSALYDGWISAEESLKHKTQANLNLFAA
ncbi:MAG TPA: hypothetical protein VHL11_14950, partial [Phototrophicaceae bacterium]|nr:hypothetical protein [Phototrophicaceae bacterium]